VLRCRSCCAGPAGLDLTVAGLVGAAALGYGIYVSFNPLVPFPADVWLFIFCGIVGLACGSYLRRSPTGSGRHRPESGPSSWCPT
jgi:hypothetical protein